MNSAVLDQTRQIFSPCGGPLPDESVKALDDIVDITEGNVATDEAGNTESIEEEASIAEE